MEKYTKADVISKVESWIRDLEELYSDSEVGTRCLVHEWEQLRKEIEK